VDCLLSGGVSIDRCLTLVSRDKCSGRAWLTTFSAVQLRSSLRPKNKFRMRVKLWWGLVGVNSQNEWTNRMFETSRTRPVSTAVLGLGSVPVPNLVFPPVVCAVIARQNKNCLVPSHQ
jgi:hypothetical protein